MAAEANEMKKSIDAELRFVTRPSEDQISRIKDFIRKRLTVSEAPLFAASFGHAAE